MNCETCEKKDSCLMYVTYSWAIPVFEGCEDFSEYKNMEDVKGVPE